jgi:hypothetical protein
MRPPETMTFYTVSYRGASSRRRVIPVTLPFVAEISDLPHYREPRSTWHRDRERGPERQPVAAPVDPRRNGANQR